MQNLQRRPTKVRLLGDAVRLSPSNNLPSKDIFLTPDEPRQSAPVEHRKSLKNMELGIPHWFDVLKELVRKEAERRKL